MIITNKYILQILKVFYLTKNIELLIIYKDVSLLVDRTLSILGNICIIYIKKIYKSCQVCKILI